MADSISFMDAVKQRYGSADDTTEEPLGAAFAKDKKWQFVGVQQARVRQSQHNRLTLVVLRGCGITVAMHSNNSSSPNDGNEVQEANMVRLEELDLSENTALTLTEVGKLLPYLPNLVTLQLCDIPTLLQQQQPTQPVPAAPALTSTRLTKLVLNNSGFTTLAQLRALVEVPQLAELHLDSNNLRSLDIAGPDASPADVEAAVFPLVTTLSLAHNALADWRAIGTAITNTFPALTQLYLTDNKLEDLLLPDDVVLRAAVAAAAGDADDEAVWRDAETAALLQPYLYLRPLTLLCLKDNATLQDPRTVDAVRVLCPRLATFRITYSALLPTWSETNARMYVVAALPTITLLNRGAVRPKERLDSELLYIQRGLQQRATAAEATAAAAAATDTQRVPYPLVDLLKEKHKDVVLAIQREGDTASSTGANYVMLEVTLYFTNGYAATTSAWAGSGAAPGGDGSQATQSHKLPSSLTVAKLKALIHKVFQIKPVNQRISFRSGDSGVLETQTPLDNEQETIGFYGVSNGAIIYVEDASLR